MLLVACWLVAAKADADVGAVFLALHLLSTCSACLGLHEMQTSICQQVLFQFLCLIVPLGVVCSCSPSLVVRSRSMWLVSFFTTTRT